MRIVEVYSHLNGKEFILVHQPELWKEIEGVIAAVDASKCKTKESKEKSKKGKTLYSPIKMNSFLRKQLKGNGWKESRTNYYVTADPKLNRDTLSLAPDEQKQAIAQTGNKPIFTYTQTDFVKNRVAVEVQFGKYSFVAYDMFVKHLSFYVGDTIDVGVEILPMKELQAEMSSGVPYYEKGLYDMLRAGRGSPPVPLVLMGVAP